MKRGYLRPRVRRSIVIQILEQRCLLSATLQVQIPTQILPVGQTPSTIYLDSNFVDSSIPTGDQVFNIQTPLGNIPVELTTGSTPETVDNFLSYINEYATTIIHGSIPGSVLEGGQYTTDGTQIENTNGTIPSEFSSVSLRNTTGTIAMSLPTGPDSATTGWFFNLSNNTQFDGSSDGGPYTAFGQVIYNGLSVLNAIAALPVVNDSAQNSAWSSLPVLNGTNGSTVSSEPASNLVTITPVHIIDGLTYTVTSSNPKIVSGTISDGDLIFKTPTKAGTAEVTVTATDLGGGTATSTFEVEVGKALPTIAPTIGKSTVPTQIVGGTATHGIVTVDVVNQTGSTGTEPVTVNVYASSDGSVDDGSVLVGAVKRSLAFSANATDAVPVPITAPTTLGAGSYTLLARTIDGAGNISDTTSGPSLTVAPPFIALTESFEKLVLPSNVVSGAKTPAVATLQITNNGNISSSGATLISLYASPDGLVDDGTLINTVTKSPVIRAGKSINVPVPLKAYPSVSDGDYSIVAQVTDPDSQISSAIYTVSTVNIAAAEIDFAATSLQPASSSGKIGRDIVVLLDLANDGNVLAKGSLQVAFSAMQVGGNSAFSLATAVTQIALMPGDSHVLRLSVPVPLGIPVDSYLLTGTVDPDNAFADPNLGNNTITSSQPISLS